MNPHRTITRSAATALGIAAYVALSAVALGCGGSNNSSTTTTTVVAVFTPDTTTPLDGSITMLSGTTSGASVNVRVTVTQVASFFGTAFRIAYDPAALLFNGMDDSSSFLRAGVTESDVLFDVNSANTAGELVITATRLDPTVAPPGQCHGNVGSRHSQFRRAPADRAEYGAGPPRVRRSKRRLRR